MQRIWPLFVAMLIALGCESQPYGGRCESNLDCDRRVGSQATSVCLLFVSGRPCPSGGLDCVCCPRDPTMRGIVPNNLCGVAVDTDAGAPDVSTDDAATDGSTPDVTAPDVAPADVTSVDTGMCPASCPPGTFCQGAVCRPGLSIGQRCGSGAECGSTFCVTGVCCNSACTCPGCSCALTPDFAGVCTAAPTGTDAGASD